MEEIALWNLLASGRIGNALGVIALILFGWLALRYANAVRGQRWHSEEPTTQTRLRQ